MTLSIGGQENIESPSLDQVRHYLRYMPPDAPFVILSRAEDSYIQSLFAESKYRVELKENGVTKYVLTDVDRASDLFGRFLAGDPALNTDGVWHRLTFWNDPFHWLPVCIVIIILMALIVGEICSAWLSNGK